MVMIRTTVSVIILIALTLALGGCGNDAATPSAELHAPSAAPSPSAGTTLTDLSAIGCATDNPEDIGELTGAWAGSEGGVYYIRHVGDCLWWFGTEIEDFEPRLTGQPGFANVASGRVIGTRIEVEWADLPIGDVLGGGGLTFMYVEEDGQLVLTEQRGDWQPFGAETLTRIEPDADPGASPTASAGP